MIHGPWTTSLGPTARAPLSDFWRRRILSLPTARAAAEKPGLNAIATILIATMTGLGTPSLSFSSRATWNQDRLSAEVRSENGPEQVGDALKSLRVVCTDEYQQPVAGAVVSLVRVRKKGLLRVMETVQERTTGARGSVEFSSKEGLTIVDPSGYELRVHAKGYDDSRHAIDLASTPEKPQRLELTSAEPLQGIVVDSEGNPIAGAHIWLDGTPASGARVAADEAGRFSLRNLSFTTDGQRSLSLDLTHVDEVNIGEGPLEGPWKKVSRRKLLAVHPGYRPAIVSVLPGHRVIQIQLQPEPPSRRRRMLRQPTVELVSSQVTQDATPVKETD